VGTDAVAWELRGKKRVYYRSRRVGRKVHRIYLGGGAAAQKAAEKDAATRAKRAAERAALAAFQSQLADADRLVAEVQQGVDVLTEATLLASGFHEHHGQWRMRRDVHPAPCGRS
jgi:hypothetical protein